MILKNLSGHLQVMNDGATSVPQYGVTVGRLYTLHKAPG